MTKKNTKWLGEIRNSQLITTYGSGALCDFPGASGIVSSINNWVFNDKNINKYKIHEPNLEILLKKKYFMQMISPDKKDKNNTDFYVPIYRFPEWYYCPKCAKKNEKISNLGSYKNLAYVKDGDKRGWKYEKVLKCENCGEKLNPSRFIVACANGHIDDFPYLWWVHKNTGLKSDEYENHKLQIIFNDKKEGLDGIIIRCITCDAERSMQGCFSKDALKGYKCPGKRPWIVAYDKDSKSEKIWVDKYCNAIPRTLLRSGNNVYYPVTESAITLPDAENVTKAKNFIDENKNLIEQYLQNGKSINEYHNTFKYGLEKLSKIPENIFVETYDRFFSGKEKDVDEQRRDLIKAEYNALCQEDASDKDKNFKLLEVDVPKKYQKYFSKVRLVKKLREVQVLSGFNRILPEFNKEDSNTQNNFGTITGENASIDIPISGKQQPWLPAIQLIGEGIFIELNPEKLQEWVTLATEEKPHYKKMRENLMSDPMGNRLKEKFSEQYVLLHTLSHLLIRQLAYDCGYNTASIKEKIYTTFNVQNKDTGVYETEESEMAGILIYTASTDSDGSLGGLVRQGETENFERLLDNTLENAYWCSNDPVCSESTGQGYRSLNYAACHACTLLPETSCEAFNSLLDRASVIGIPGNEEYENFGFFDLDELKNE